VNEQPTAFSKQIEEARRLTRKKLLGESNIPKQYLSAKWQEYRPDWNGSTIHDESIINSRREAKKNCLNYVGNFKKTKEDGGNSILIVGERTSGKTVLATLILREAIKYFNERVLFVSFPQFVVEANTANLGPERERLESKYIRPYFLCIDEITSIDRNPKVRTYFSHILVERHGLKKPTILTSKINIEQIRKSFGNVIYDILTNQYNFGKIFIKTSDKDFVDLYDLFSDDKAKFSCKRLIDLVTNKRSSGDGVVLSDDVILTGESLLELITKSISANVDKGGRSE
jgi:DNA replication protein DnaC